MSKEVSLDQNAFIYGLFKKDSEHCSYIGQTFHPVFRKRQHFNYLHGKATNHDLEFRLLDITAREKASELETRYIQRYKNINQCELNKRVKESTKYKPSVKWLVKWKETGMIFEGMNQASRYFEISISVITHGFNVSKNGIFYLKSGVTLERRENPKRD
jgi:hypothetical protein